MTAARLAEDTDFATEVLHSQRAMHVVVTRQIENILTRLMQHASARGGQLAWPTLLIYGKAVGRTTTSFHVEAVVASGADLDDAMQSGEPPWVGTERRLEAEAAELRSQKLAAQEHAGELAGRLRAAAAELRGILDAAPMQRVEIDRSVLYGIEQRLLLQADRPQAAAEPVEDEPEGPEYRLPYAD